MGTFDLWGLSLRHPRTRGRKETMTGVGGWVVPLLETGGESPA